MNAIAEVITMLEGVRGEVAAEREAIERQVAELHRQGDDLMTRDRMLVSAIATLHDVAERTRAARDGSGAAAEGPHPGPLPQAREGARADELEDAQRAPNRDASAVDEPYPEAGPQAEASLAGTGSGMPAGRGAHSREGAASPAEAEAASSGTAAPVAADGDVIGALIRAIDAAPAELAAEQVVDGRVKPGHDGGDETVALPPPTPARPEPAYRGVGIKAPSLGDVAPGTPVAMPLVDDRPSGERYIGEGERLANRIAAELDILMAEFPGGPTVRQLSDRYEAPSARVTDAMRRLQDTRRASVHKRPTTGFRHLMRFGERP